LYRRSDGRKVAVGKGGVKNMDIDRFNLKKLNEGEVSEKYQVTIKNIFQLSKT
jgi:hypothetical protein